MNNIYAYKLYLTSVRNRKQSLEQTLIFQTVREGQPFGFDTRVLKWIHIKQKE